MDWEWNEWQLLLEEGGHEGAAEMPIGLGTILGRIKIL